jgi:glycosyltransferase involved in cell wall biosynthesis
MKISMLDASLFTGRYDDSLCAALGGAGHDVTLFGRPMRKTDAIVPQGYAYRPRFFPLSERIRPAIGEGRAFRVLKAAEYGVDCLAGPIGAIAAANVAHVQWLPLAAADRHLLRRLRGRTALVHTVHNATPYHGGRSAAVQAAGYRTLLDQFDALIVHGAPTRDALLDQGIEPSRIFVIPHPPMRIAPADAAAMASVPDPKLPRLLFFGTIRPYKGFDVLVEAALALWRAGARFELAVAGKPFVDVAPLFGRIDKEGFGRNVIFDLGFMEEQRLDAHLRKADMIVFPYRQIDSSGAFLTALGYGKAMVASDAGMFGSLPRDADGASPVALAEAGNAPVLAEALLPLLESAAQRAIAGKRALALGERLGNWAETAEHTTRAYQSAIAARVLR